MQVGLLGGGCEERDDVRGRAAAGGDAGRDAGDAGARSRGGTGRTGELRVALPRIPSLLNPTVSADAQARLITFRTVFEPLVVLKTDGSYQPFLAGKMEVRARGKRFLFHLRPGATFHDGRPLTSRDVEYTFEVLRKIAVPRLDLLRAELRNVLEVRPHGDRRVEFALRRTNHVFPSVLAEVGILPAHVYGRRGIRHPALVRQPVGTGPFKMEQRADSKQAVLVRNDNYWGRRTRLRRVVFRAVPGAAQTLAGLRNGELDLVPRLHPSYYPRQVKTPRMKRRFRLLRIHPYRLRVLLFNLARGPFKDRRLRRALVRAIDRQQLVRKARNGLGVVPSGPLWTLSPGYNRTLHALSHDRRAAERLLSAAGWRDPRGRGTRRRLGHPLRLSVLRARAPERLDAISNQIKAELQAVGVDARVKEGDFAYLKLQLRRRRFDMAVLSIAPRPESDLSPLFHSTGRLNVGGYSNPAADRLLTAIRAAEDAPLRARLTRRLHRVLHDDPPAVVLYEPIELMLVSRRVGGLANNGRAPLLSTLTVGE